MLVVQLVWWAIRGFIRTAHGTLGPVVREVAKAAQAATERDTSAATSHARQAALEAVAWYGPVAARRSYPKFRTRVLSGPLFNPLYVTL
jgi:hypothetical protein